MNMTTDPELLTRLAQLGFTEGAYKITPHNMMRRHMARRLSESFRDIPHFSLFGAIPADPAQDWRRVASERDVRVSLNDILLAAAGRALRDVPAMNVSYVPEGMIEHGGADVALAVAVKAGVVAPIVRGADVKEMTALAEETRSLIERARAMKLKPEEYQGGSLTISNLGMYGVASFTSIVNPPQSAILSVGAVEERLAMHDGVVMSTRVMAVTLTCDHRAVDGAIAAQWLNAFRARLETLDWAG